MAGIDVRCAGGGFFSPCGLRLNLRTDDIDIGKWGWIKKTTPLGVRYYCRRHAKEHR